MANETEPETKRTYFSKEEVAMILAHYIARVHVETLVNPRLEIGTHDIALVSEVVE